MDFKFSRWTFVLLALALPTGLVAQTPAAPRSDAIRLYLDCQGMWCDLDFLRREITFVDFVRDRQDADVHVLGRSEASGGGQMFRFSFIGMGNFDGTTAELNYAASATNTDAEDRAAISRTLKMGLVQFVAQTSLADQIQIIHERPTATQIDTDTSHEDPWNFWVFRIQAGGSINGEQISKGYRVNGSVTASRVTEDWKIDLRTSGNYRRSDFEVDSVTTIVNKSRNYSANAMVVRSINEHWSAGFKSSATASTFDNTNLRLRTAPTVEYNFFPYGESSSRALILQYSIGINSVNYEEETIFSKTEETLFEHSLLASLEFTQPWGNAWIRMEGGQLLNQTDKSHLTLFGFTRFRLVRGLSFNMYGSISRVRDDLAVPSRQLPPEEILLRLRRLATDYRYSASMGFTYQFGSIFNNIVNPRFGSSGGVMFFN